MTLHRRTDPAAYDLVKGYAGGPVHEADRGGGARLGLAAQSAHDDDQNDHEDREDQRHDDADNQASDILGRREWNSGQRETSEDHVAPHERDHKTERSPKRARNRFPDL